jgi:predicted  nucleic acid-binding Zn-ribbon protein
MNEDLSAVLALWRNVHAAERLRAERASFAERERQASEEQRRSEEARQEACVALEAVVAEERAVMRKLESYQKRIETTRAMIEAGKAPDYRLADQQLRSCLEIADDLETRALELMEQRDEAEAHLARARGAAARAVQQIGDHAAAAAARQPAIVEELRSLEAARPELESLVPAPLLAAFRALRERGRSAVSPLKEGACSLCNYGAPAQVLLEIKNGVRVHQCRNCQRFLLPEE